MGLGDTSIFADYADWLLLPFKVIGSSAVDNVNNFMQPVTNAGNKFVSTLTGYNVVPVLDANKAFADVTKVSIAPPTSDANGNLQMQPLDLTAAINQGFANAVDYQTYQDSSYGGTGTPSTGSTIGLWILLGVGGLVVLDIIKNLKK